VTTPLALARLFSYIIIKLRRWFPTAQHKSAPRRMDRRRRWVRSLIGILAAAVGLAATLVLLQRTDGRIAASGGAVDDGHPPPRDRHEDEEQHDEPAMAATVDGAGNDQSLSATANAHRDESHYGYGTKVARGAAAAIVEAASGGNFELEHQELIFPYGKWGAAHSSTVLALGRDRSLSPVCRRCISSSVVTAQTDHGRTSILKMKRAARASPASAT